MYRRRIGEQQRRVGLARSRGPPSPDRAGRRSRGSSPTSCRGAAPSVIAASARAARRRRAKGAGPVAGDDELLSVGDGGVGQRQRRGAIGRRRYARVRRGRRRAARRHQRQERQEPTNAAHAPSSHDQEVARVGSAHYCCRMEYQRLGTTGLRVSRICLGCMSYGDPDAVAAGTRRSAGSGRCAKKSRARSSSARSSSASTSSTPPTSTRSARSEEITGRALKQLARREDVVIATKVYNADAPRAERPRAVAQAILHEVDASLRRLGTDYVDLYQIHRWDDGTPIEETMEALHDVVKSGQGALSRRVVDVGVAVRQGASGRREARLDALRRRCRTTGTSSIARRSARWRRSASTRASASFRGARWRAGGWRARRRRRRRRRRRAPRPISSASASTRRRTTPMRAWSRRSTRWRARASCRTRRWRWRGSCKSAGVTAPIVGATKMQHLEDAVAALAVKLEASEVRALEAAYVPHAVAGHS